MARTPKQAASATVLIVGCLAVIYLVVCLQGDLPWMEQLVEGPVTTDLMAAGAKVNPWVSAGQWYRLVTSTVLHGDLIHLLANSLCLAVLVPFCVLCMGLAPTLTCWLAGGFFGQLASFVTDVGTSIGASGGVFALAAMAAVHLAVERSPQGRGRSVPWGLVAAVALGVSLAAGGEGIDQAAHGGGAAAGLIMGAILSLRSDLFGRVTMGVAVCCLALVAQGVWGPPLPPASDALQEMPGEPMIALPRVGSRGLYVGGRCLVQDHEASVGAPICVAVSGEMLLVAGATESVLAADEVARRHRPPVGRCVRYTGDGEQVLLIHPREGLLIALATRVQAWERYRGLRAALRSGRCPNR